MTDVRWGDIIWSMNDLVLFALRATLYLHSLRYPTEFLEQDLHFDVLNKCIYRHLRLGFTDEMVQHSHTLLGWREEECNGNAELSEGALAAEIVQYALIDIHLLETGHLLVDHPLSLPDLECRLSSEPIRHGEVNLFRLCKSKSSIFAHSKGTQR